MARQQFNIVEYYTDQEIHTCGYCNSPNANFSHGMWAHSLSVQDYQNLIDRGWRRSGSYCYKPIMDKTCCPTYTIKCEALNFKISKSQRKILKRMIKFLRNELSKSELMETDQDQHDNIDISSEEISNYSERAERVQKNVAKMHVSIAMEEINGIQQNEPMASLSSTVDVDGENSKTKKIQTVRDTEKRSTDEVLKPCKKAKLLRLERKRKKLLAKGMSLQEIEEMFKQRKQQNQPKSIEELFEEVYGSSKKLELRLVRTAPMSSAYKNTSKKSYEVYKKYETTIHKVAPEKATEQQYIGFLVRSPLQIKLVKVMSDELIDSLDKSARLYKKYQMAVHKDQPEECTEKAFVSFLVKSPLQQWTPANGPPHGYGSFHEQYWLDNELIAVAVIDILPSCVSSVYFFYDPEYSFLSLGTFSSLREVCLTRQLNKMAPDLKYYCLGFYIHSCPKMRYKARMKPSKLLCPETYKWFDIDTCLAKLDKAKYSRLNDDIDAIDEDGIVDINKVLVVYCDVAMPYRIYKAHAHVTSEEEKDVENYARLVGSKCAQSLLLYRS